MLERQVKMVQSAHARIMFQDDIALGVLDKLYFYYTSKVDFIGFYGCYRSILAGGYDDGIWRLYHYSNGLWVVLGVICRKSICTSCSHKS